jgi:hypothetical protein
MLTVRRYRIIVPTATSDVSFEPRYVEPLLRAKYRTKLPSLALPITVDEIPAELRHPSLVAYSFATVEDEARRLRTQFPTAVDEFGRHALDVAFPVGIKQAIIDEVEAYESAVDAAASDIEPSTDLLTLLGVKDLESDAGKDQVALARTMMATGYSTLPAIAAADPFTLAALPGISLTRARALISKASKKRGAVMVEPIAGAATMTPLISADALGITSREGVAASARR